MSSKDDVRLVGSSEDRNYWQDGLYSVTYLHEGEIDSRRSRTLAVLREGTIVGSDEHGGVFEGLFATTRCGSAAYVVLKLRVPPGGVLVTGERVGETEAVVEVAGVLSNRNGELQGVCDIRGHWMGMRFRYVGRLPH
ncbi:MAG: hypothetical protein APF80_07205 [Alphaproteobacteria bacterium BRH_c36]|nr:MAG: hypothetical protein APF80_07205 [Alphaproteobacteria bacterium BRH_c36]